MKLGLIARADNSGLGMQTWEFYKAMEPDKTMVVDISKLNGNRIYPERYPNSMYVRGIPTPAQIDFFLYGLDVVFVAEAPYNFYLYERAKELGVKVAVQYNYEFFDWFVHPDWPMPDMLIAPSQWHFDEIQAFCDTNNIQHIYLHCPVNSEVLPHRKITVAQTFLHTAGRSAAHDRNGTKIVIEAAKYLKTPAQILIHFQGEQGLAHQATMTTQDYRDYLADGRNASNVTILTQEFANYADVYAMGDVLLLPRRYGGNCLPLNEALSSGMPVIMTDISPNNEFLPHDWLLPATKIAEFTPRTTIDIYGADPKQLAAKIDEMYNFDASRMEMQNQVAEQIAQTISWQTMKPEYEAAFEELCTL